MAEVRKGDREKTGFDDGSFPVATAAQASSAIKLRHHSKSHSAAEVLAHVSRRIGAMLKAGQISAGAHRRLMRKIEEARSADRQGGK